MAWGCEGVTALRFGVEMEGFWHPSRSAKDLSAKRAELITSSSRFENFVKRFDGDIKSKQRDVNFENNSMQYTIELCMAVEKG